MADERPWVQPRVWLSREEIARMYPDPESDEAARERAAMLRGRLWMVWRPFSWRQRIATFLRGGGWHDGEWIDPNAYAREVDHG